VGRNTNWVVTVPAQQYEKVKQ